ncbi:MAG: hypothetical protein ACIAXF_08150 [Phycisphaerales bacterium JB063]
MDFSRADSTQATHASDAPQAGGEAVGLLALLDASGKDMGTELLRLAHLAAARHRFEAATQHQATGNAMPQASGGTR